jgi:hypothetical protein
MPSNRTPTRFYGPATPDTSEETLYTVPSNKIAVIRALNVSGESSESGTQYLNIYVGAGSPATKVYFKQWAQGEDPTEPVSWQYLVLTEGETLRAITDQGIVTLTVDGDLYDE